MGPYSFKMLMGSCIINPIPLSRNDLVNSLGIFRISSWFYFGLVFEREIHSVLNHSLGVVRGHDFMEVSGPRGEERDLGGVIKCIASVCLIKKQALGFPGLHL